LCTLCSVSWMSCSISVWSTRSSLRCLCCWNFGTATTACSKAALGAYLASPDHAKACTKRLSTLLRSARWAASLIEHFLGQQADNQGAAFQQAGEEALLLWDERVIEQGASAQPHQTGVLQSPRWAAHLRPRDATF